jgi:excinuclease ABC subunit B
LPEVSLVAIIDADKEGFLRSETSLIQTMGRAARHQDGKVIMYADKMTGSMERAIKITVDRRKIQEAYNIEHGITPTTVQKALADSMQAEKDAETVDVENIDFKKIPKDELLFITKQLSEQMELAAANLQFEKAAEIRDQIEEVKDVISSKRMSK